MSKDKKPASKKMLGGRGFRRHEAKKEKTEGRKSINDYNYYLGSATQASDYESTTEFIINFIKKTFDYGNDIGTSLKDLCPVDKEKWRVMMKFSSASDTSQKEQENRQFELEFKSDYEGYMRRVNAYENNMIKAYAMIWERCTKGMKQKIEARIEFSSRIENNPIELLKAVKEHTQNFQEHRYNMSIVLDSLRSLLNAKQKEGESLQDWTKRFRTARDILVSHLGGPLIFKKIVESMSDFNIDDDLSVTKCQERTFECFLAYLYLENADRSKYGSLLVGLNTQQSLGNDQYPKSVTEANNVLSNHKLDMTSKLRKEVNETKFKTDKVKKENEDSREQEITLSFAQMEGKCYCCGKPGHKSPQCRFKNKPREEWAIHKSQQNFAQAQETGSSTNPTSTPSTDQTQSSESTRTSNGWAGTHIQYGFAQVDTMQKWILLDNQSSVTVFSNKDLVTNIRTTQDTLNLHTNGGVLTTNLKCDIPHWGEAWFAPNGITNIFSYSEMAKKYKITSDSSIDTAFTVHLPERKVRFEELDNGLYVFIPKQYRNVQFLSSIEENKGFFTKNQFERAKKARDLYHAIGTPSINDFKAILRMNMISNNPVTTEDINVAERIFGPDIGALKGKTTRKKPIKVIDDHIEIPKELIASQHAITLCIDIMNVNGLQFVTTISKNLRYRTAQFISSRSPREYAKVIKEVIAMYRKAGFQVTHIYCDNEFKPLMTHLADKESTIQINYSNPNEHVPDIERSIRVIKERIRSTYHRLLYDRLPKIMVKMLVSESAKKLNFFPAKGGVSLYYSPRMILHRRNMDYEKHCKYAFGAYVQAHDDPKPKNSNEPRTLDCIYLRYSDNLQGGHELLHLPTNQIITRQYVTPSPITQAIIKQVNDIAKLENMPLGLKIKSKTNNLFYDHAWIAGVDYHHSENHSENENESENESEDKSDDGDEESIEDDFYDEMDPDEIQGLGKQQFNNQTMIEEMEESDTNSVNSTNESNDETNEGANDSDDSQPRDNILADQPGVTVTRSGRVSRAPTKLSLQQSVSSNAIIEEYSMESARVITKVISLMNMGVIERRTMQGQQFVQTFSLAKGLQKYGEKGKQAAMKEMQQLHERTVFEPISIDELTTIERKRALESLIFLTEKRDGNVKGRTCANGSTQRGYVGRDEAASPTAITESILLTAVIDAKEGRDVMVADVPNAFVQTAIEPKEKGERVIMKIRGALVDMLVELDSQKYEPYVTDERGNKVLYVNMLKALYGMLQSALLYYKKFRKDIEDIGFKINPYDPCVANRIVDGKQHTITWHVDDVKSSHVDKHVNDEFLHWLRAMYASDGIGEVKATRGLKHDYLGMTLDYTLPGSLKVDMTRYVNAMVEEFPDDLSGKATCAWNENLFKVNKDAKKLSKEKAAIFHTFVMKGMFLCKRGRQDIQPGIAFLTTRVSEPNEDDWRKLIKIMKFLKGTKESITTISMDDSNTIKWYVDAAFAVHKDLKSHTGAVMTLGNGVLCSISTKQKVNSRSSTEAEFIAVDDVISKVLWTKLFLENQGQNISMNVIYRDNQSAMKMELNGKASSGKRTRHFDIKYYYITDLIKRKLVQIEYCPTNEMIADYMTKPIVGSKFNIMWKKVLGEIPIVVQQECVG